MNQLGDKPEEIRKHLTEEKHPTDQNKAPHPDPGEEGDVESPTDGRPDPSEDPAPADRPPAPGTHD
ncbi:hypothetical protein [Streptomyces lichenis]|uniref:Uncharacterized protein n=1 Tax=Streptomyces lichenis TaxID=2306967 RepID=A0ABT0I8M2_9ACTN|nr:hypothetical protein [Streptomyces lichenis]MCK8677677.1 hypothetical protein [Streptomyces lichenis]